MCRNGLSFIFLIFMLNTDYPILRVLAVKIYEIKRLYFQKTNTVKRVDHCVLPFRIDESFFADGAHAHNIEALFRQSDVILGLVHEETRDLGLPQLEALELLKHGALIRFA